MKAQGIKYALLLLLILGVTMESSSQERNRILFVFDASNSMNGYWEKERKIETATRLLSESLQKLSHSENLELGLRVYGHQTKHVTGKQDCEDTELVVPISTGTNLIIQQELRKITPKGTTPIARSLELSAGDFDDCPDCRNIIILITDGIEACDGDPCAVSRALQAKGITLKPFIIGIGIEELYKSNLECVGTFFDATKEETFKDILDIVITQALNNTSAQISLLDGQNKAVETNIPLTIYDQEKNVVVQDWVQTLNREGVPDTVSLDPLLTYKVVAHTYPPVVLEDVHLNPGEHNHIELKTPQGTLNLVQQSHLDFRDPISCVIRKKGDCDAIHYQRYGTQEKYLEGEYDIEILTLPPTLIEGVQIKNHETTDIQIPKPGVLFLNTGTNGYGGIFHEVKGETKEVVRFTFGEQESRYTLQPGNYTVVFRSKRSNSTLYTFKKEFTIVSGKNTNVSI